MDDQTLMDWLNLGNNIGMDWFTLTHPATQGNLGVGVNVTRSGVNVNAGGSTLLIILAVAAIFLLKD
jgi:hypothetical protein